MQRSVSSLQSGTYELHLEIANGRHNYFAGPSVDTSSFDFVMVLMEEVQ